MPKIRKSNPRPLYVTVLCAFLVALSIVCGKLLQIPVGEVLRFSFENLPILFAGLLFGPVAGMLVGTVADLIGCLVVGYAINPLVTLGAATIGLVAGVGGRLLRGLPLVWRVSLTVLAAHLLGSVTIKTVGLLQFYPMPFWVLFGWRGLNYAIVGAAECVLLCLLLNHAGLRRMVGGEESGREGKMTYEEALHYIHSVNWTFCKPGLERIAALCEGLGNPQKDLRFVHVTGTNGKGSFCAMTASVLQAAGYRTGLFTSPYIKTFNERMMVDGQMISQQELAELTARVRPVADGMTDKPTEFELITAIGFLYFQRHHCDVVVLEAGMGGRLDSTNLIDAPLLAVITGVALDHTAFLGDTVEQIATEKAGIIKIGSPVLYGGEDLSAGQVIAAVAEDRGCTYHTVSYDSLQVSESTLEGTVFDYGAYTGLRLSLLGSYQPKNAAVVLNAVDILRQQGLRIPEAAVRTGLTAVKWPGRFELLSRDPVVIYDGAHNAQGVAAAVDSIRLYFGQERVFVLTGVLQDKDYSAIARDIAKVASRAFVLTPDNPRALPGEEYAALLSEMGVPAQAYGDIPQAYRAAVEAAARENVPLVCLGSLYTYASLL